MKDGEKKPKASPINGQPVPSNPNGRPKGVPNKSTTRFKEALNTLFEDNAERMAGWLEQVDNPKDRFDILHKFVEVLYPKLARQEITGKDGGAIETKLDIKSLPPQEAYKELLK